MDIQVTFVGMEPTNSLKEYVKEKIGKYDNFLKTATKVEVFLKEFQNRNGTNSVFRVDINVILPKTKVRVEESGEDMYANIDKATDILARRLKRYQDKWYQWEGEKPWKVVEAETQLEQMEGDESENYTEYIPRIAVRLKLEDMSPLEEAEAIEKMELSGYDQMLFRSKKTEKISMVYKRKDGTYGLVEPADML